MKRIIFCLLLLSLLLVSAYSQDSGPFFTFGMPFQIQYNLPAGNLTLWNLRYDLGLDFYLQIDPSVYMGLETGVVFGFRKNTITDKNIDAVYMDFPIRLLVLWKPTILVLEGYASFVYQGSAVLTNGTLYAEDIIFTPAYEIGARIGVGDLSFFFIDIGYIIGDEACMHLGIGARVGLF